MTVEAETCVMVRLGEGTVAATWAARRLKEMGGCRVGCAWKSECGASTVGVSGDGDGGKTE